MTSPPRHAPTRRQLMKAGLSFRAEPLDVGLSPWHPTNLQTSLLLRHVPALFRASLEATRKFLEEPPFRTRFAFGSLQEQCILKDPGYVPDIPLGRMDCFLKDEGLKFLEFNTDGTAGWHYSWALNGLARERLGLPPEPHPLPDRLLTALVKVFSLWAGGGRAKPRMAIVDWAEVGTRSEQEALAATFCKAGYPTTLEDPRGVQFRDGRLVGTSGAIDLVYRRVVSEELFSRADEVRPLLEAYLSGAACFVGPFRSDPAWSKTLFAVFSDPAFRAGLQPGDQASLQETVPFTAPLEEGVLTYRGATYDARTLLEEERPYFVVKPAKGYGGRGIRAGALTPAGEWKSFLDEAIRRGGWVLQEFVEPPVHPIPDGGGFGFLNVGAFVLLGSLAGLMARLTETPLLTAEAREIWLPAEMPPLER